MYLTNFCCLVSVNGSLVNWSNFVLIVSDFHSSFLLGSIFVGDDSDDRQQGSLKVSRMPKKKPVTHLRFRLFCSMLK